MEIAHNTIDSGAEALAVVGAEGEVHHNLVVSDVASGVAISFQGPQL